MSTDSSSLNDGECAIIKNYRKLTEKDEMLLSDFLNSSEHVNDINNLSSISGEDNLEMSATLRNTNDTSDDKLIETNVSDDASQLSQTECKYLLSLFDKNNLECADLNTQDEKLLTSITRKNLKYILNSNKDELDVNTQQFIDLNLRRVVQQLEIFEPPHVDVPKKQTTEFTDVGDLVTVPSTSTSSSNESKHNNKCSDKPKLPEKCNSPRSTCDVELSYRHTNLSAQQQDPEIVMFQDMCQKVMTIRPIDDNDVNNSIIVKVNNHVNRIDFKRVNEDVISCINFEECVPSTSAFNSTVSDCFPKTIDHEYIVSKSHTSSSGTLSSCNASSPEYPYCQYKKSTLNCSKNNSKFSSDKIVTEFNTSREINLINELSSEDEDNCKIKRKLLKVTNIKMNGHKKIKHDNSSQQNFVTGTTQVVHVSPYGFIHEDMLKYANSKSDV